MTGTDKGDIRRGGIEQPTSVPAATGGRDDALYDKGVSAPPEWIIRRGTEEFRAPALKELLRWSRERRVVATDLVFDPTKATWMLAQNVPQLAGIFPRSRSMSTMFKPLILVAAAMVVLPILGIATCAGIGVVSALLDPHRVHVADAARRATKPLLIVSERSRRSRRYRRSD